MVRCFPLQLLLSIALLAAVTAPLVAAGAPLEGSDLQYWNDAEKTQIKSANLNHDGVESFADVKNLKLKALIEAQRTGVTRIGTEANRFWRSKKLYFTTVIRPNSNLGKEMQLGDRAALAFFRQTRKRTELLHIGTVPNAKLDVPTNVLGDVIKHF